MQNLIDILKEKVSEAIMKAFGNEMQDPSLYLPAEMTQTSQKQFGSYQCNSSLKLGKALKEIFMFLRLLSTNFIEENMQPN